ncbi:MAG: DUF4956 domain-containing protein [Gemmatimonas sp.]|jgi:hypothetical protein|uniref:DUF4956 domain-containing protein n=1 Tax=Gemmatimonas sp. TaxID=1962908 RepID=UPI0022BBEE30|nr:DUF4956 domain-containing protein [Gemmatimonas sp.]MCA2983252.1 DUF4956 domain-containing protein [Gemmatimonas sp.]MCA2987885.1 DUF4956 domain-containing protein [Gemmatimonas sp.]MCA2993834.1 DUF4956 domain-containing protein [Gemmatimonas sp.]MCE2955104.1 DUF4956 domain-containing protein [Gemmatimonas sp.]MCZ8011172.1 DUF4956 domain-containing protein [Gemmatimonas sp.]
MTGWRNTPATRVIVRCLAYYLALIGGTALAVRQWANRLPPSLEALMGLGTETVPGGATSLQDLVAAGPASGLDEATLALTVGVAMIAAALLSLPVAWVYLLTRAKRGYQQSVVQLLIILPTVVAGIVLLVKYSLALAFSLAGIVAAVRFRNSLDDSKDAVYVFLATAIGLSSAVNLPVAAVLSLTFNLLAFALWYTDFGSAPAELDGRLAERKLQRAKQLARTGTFVARMDDEVLKNMTTEQLEGLAERAWRRAKANNMTTEMPVVVEERTLRLSTSNANGLRRVLEPRLSEFTKTWRFGGMQTGDETTVIEYHVQLRKKTGPEELLSLVRAAGASELTAAEIE